MPEARRGVLAAFEGLDGSGKTTQARRAVAALEERGREALFLREPTDGPIGQRIRQLMKAGREAVPPREEMELFLQDRRWNVETNIAPALERGAVVCLDRYYISSMAYQGALGLDSAEIRRLNEAFAPVPDLILYFSLPVSVSIQRIRASRSEGPNLFEREEYLERVAGLFQSFQFPMRVDIDAAQDVDAVFEKVWESLWPIAEAKARFL